MSDRSYNGLQNKLFVKTEKFDFHVSTVSFLGFILEKGQVKTDSEKVRAVAEWPCPTNLKEL